MIQFMQQQLGYFHKSQAVFDLGLLTINLYPHVFEKPNKPTMKSAAKILSAPSKYHWSFPLFLLYSIDLQPPKSTSSVCETKVGAPGHLSAMPQTQSCCSSHCLNSPFTWSHITLQAAPKSTYLPDLCFSFLFSDCQCLILLSLPQYHSYFAFSLERPEQKRAYAISIASLLLAQIGTGDVVREDTLEIGGEYALYFFFMLNTLQATAQVKESNTSSGFNILKLAF